MIKEINLTDIFILQYIYCTVYEQYDIEYYIL